MKLRRLRALPSLLRGFFGLAREQRAWWLLALGVILAVLGLVMLAGKTLGPSALMYTFF